MLGQDTVNLSRCDILGPRPNKPQGAEEQQLCILLGQGTVILSRSVCVTFIDQINSKVFGEWGGAAGARSGHSYSEQVSQCPSAACCTTAQTSTPGCKTLKPIYIICMRIFVGELNQCGGATTTVRVQLTCLLNGAHSLLDYNSPNPLD